MKGNFVALTPSYYYKKMMRFQYVNHKESEADWLACRASGFVQLICLLGIIIFVQLPNPWIRTQKYV